MIFLAHQQGHKVSETGGVTPAATGSFPWALYSRALVIGLLGWEMVQRV